MGKGPALFDLLKKTFNREKTIEFSLYISRSLNSFNFKTKNFYPVSKNIVNFIHILRVKWNSKFSLKKFALNITINCQVFEKNLES